MKRLDLHGMRYSDARRNVERLIDWMVIHNEEQIDIVTGHSPNMRELVVGVAEMYGLEYEIGGPLGIDDAFIRVYL